MTKNIELGTLASTINVLTEIAEERIRQDAKFGEQNHKDMTGLTGDRERADSARHVCDSMTEVGAVSWRDILFEEVMEALAEKDPARLRAELVQVAAVCVSWAEAIDRRAEQNG